MTPSQILSLAQHLLARPDARTAGLWPRATALLARQALEQALDDHWHQRGLALHTASTRCQLICLQQYLPDPHLAGRVHHAWSSLSQACHHHPYDLAPSFEELTALLATVSDLVSAVAAHKTH
jgi:hypothetical protein